MPLGRWEGGEAEEKAVAPSNMKNNNNSASAYKSEPRKRALLLLRPHDSHADLDYWERINKHALWISSSSVDLEPTLDDIPTL